MSHLHLDSLQPERCCLMVIDPQERLMKAIHKAKRVEKNISLLINCSQILNLPVIATTQYVKGLGGYVEGIERLLGDLKKIDKMEFNALDNPKVQVTLNDLSKAVDTLLITGVEAHICIYQTALGAIRAGYRPWIMEDAVSSREKQNSRAAIRRMTQLGIPVITTEMAIYDLLKRAGTPQFKQMLTFLK